MTPDQVRSVLTIYEEFFSARCSEPVRDEGKVAPTEHVAVAHLYWMTTQVPVFLEGGDIEKAMRWLGFIQGGMWSWGFFTIEEMKEHNR